MIDADALKRRAQKVATEAWKMRLTANVETVLHQFIDWIDQADTVETFSYGHENDWIPCPEKLPEDGTEVFVYLFNRPSPYIAWIDDCRWYTEDFEVESENEPIAWMPLPEPYRGGKQDG